LDVRLQFPDGSSTGEPHPEPEVFMRPNSHFLRTLVVGVPLLLGLHEAHAQTPDSVEIREMLRRAQNRNWYVRVHTDTVSAQGRVLFVRDTTATVGRTPVRYSSVLTVERRDMRGSLKAQSSRSSAMMLGSFTAIFAGAICLSGFCPPQALLIGTSGFVVGGLVGGAFGQITEHGTAVWTPVWPDSMPAAQRAAVGRPAPRRGASGVNTYVGVLMWSKEKLDPPTRFPTLYGVSAHRDFGRLETIPLSVSAALIPHYAASVSVQAGANFRLTPDVFAGASAGAAFIKDPYNPAPELTLRVGAGDGKYSGMRMEAQFTTVFSVVPRPHLYLVIGHTVRQR
jgi:hypothetical protein